MPIFAASAARPDPAGSAWYFRSRACWRGARSSKTSASRLPPERAGIELTDLVETLGLGAHLARYPGELSLGLARRAAIARAFAVDPDFLLLDEPFVSLDEATADRLRNELTALTTPDQGDDAVRDPSILPEAVQLADRLFFLAERPTRIILEKRSAAAAWHAQQGFGGVDQR